MRVGIPKEIKVSENRVAMVPAGVEALVSRGHEVFVETQAGANSGFPDEAYEEAGAKILGTAAEVWEQAELIVKVKEPQPVELEKIKPGHTVFTYFHFAASRELTEGFLKTQATAIAYETVTNSEGRLPLLEPMSEVAGRMAAQEGAKYLEKRMGGRGILLGGVPGVTPATVLVLGGGIVGYNAAKITAGMGALTYILDINLDRLRTLDEIMPRNVIPLYSSPETIRNLLPRVDLLIGAVLIPGARAPYLVSRDMLKLMRPGSVIVDVAVDQGGCVETCRPTTHDNPTYEVDGIIHYCVANMPGAVPYTSTIALTNATLPYVLKIADQGPLAALQSDPGFLEGLNMFRGHITCEAVSKAFDLPYTPAKELLG